VRSDPASLHPSHIQQGAASGPNEVVERWGQGGKLGGLGSGGMDVLP
jgi:hypothetical protein